jgi:alpha-tubulin suppressor-like RCC1 family protein
MTAGTSQGRAARRRPWRARPAAAGLAAALATGLVIPALAAAGGTGVAAASAGATAASISPARTGAGRPAGTAGAAAAGTASRAVLAWGRNAFGALGDGTTTDSDVPVRVHLPAGTKVTQMRAGCIHTLALTSAGHVLAWGANGDGQLGDGTTTSSDVPVKVKIPRGTKVTSVRAGCVFSLALTSTGQVLAWGDNLDGQLGDGSTSNSDTPVRVRLPAGTTVTAISAGQDFGLARTSKGHVRAWGHGDGGRLGDGSVSNSDTPVKVKLPTGARVKALAAGGTHSLALTSDGLFAWGFNGDGQLGDGTTTSSATPVRIFILVRGRSLGHVTSLFAGCSHSLVLFSGGALFAWGDNTSGQLGDGTSTSSDKPVGVALPAGTRVRAVSAGCTDSYALTVKGSVLAWGYNEYGELGDGSDTQSSTPVRVELPAGWRASAVIAGPGADHALAMVHEKS